MGAASLGAPRGNANAMRHGVSSYLCLGRLPKGGAYIRRQLSLLKHQLEKDVQDLYGELTTYHAALIQSACRHEGRAQLLTRWMRQIEDKAREQGCTVGTAERVAIGKEIGSATNARDRHSVLAKCADTCGVFHSTNCCGC